MILPKSVAVGENTGSVADDIQTWLNEIIKAIKSFFQALADAPWFREAVKAIYDFLQWFVDTSARISLDVFNFSSLFMHEHPYWVLFVSSIIFFGPQILLLPVLIFDFACILILFILGFGSAGVRRGSLASSYQSVNYGAVTPAGGPFASATSQAAAPSWMWTSFSGMWMSEPLLLCVRLAAGALGAYVLLWIILS